MFTLYVPGGHGGHVSDNREQNGITVRRRRGTGCANVARRDNRGHRDKFFDSLYCVYTMFPAVPAAPFASNVACRGVLVIYFSDFQDLLRFVTFSLVLRYVTVTHDPSRLLARSITACYVLLRSVAFLPRCNTFFRSVKVIYGRNVDTLQYKAHFCPFVYE